MKRPMKVQVRMGGWDGGHRHSMRQTTGHAPRKIQQWHKVWKGKGRVGRKADRREEERFIFTLFTRRTHHPQLERRCLDKDNPRADPVCMWWQYPGWRWTRLASWSLAQHCECFEGRPEQNVWRSWSRTRRKEALGAWSVFLPPVKRRREHPGTGPRVPKSH